MNCSQESTGRESPWWTGAKAWGRSLVGRETLLLLGSAAAVQVVLLFRTDFASHVVLGGALSLFFAASCPSRIAENIGEWVVAAIFAVVGLGAIAIELTIYGPFDLVDVAFTLGGALVVAEGSSTVSTAVAREKSRVLVAAIVLLALAWLYRTLTGFSTL